METADLLTTGQRQKIREAELEALVLDILSPQPQTELGIYWQKTKQARQAQEFKATFQSAIADHPAIKFAVQHPAGRKI